MLADGRTVENDIGYVWIRVGEKSTITVVIFAEPDSEPFLGAYTLEGLALAADVRNQRLVQMPWLLLGELLPA
jgi:predicted aspartyl protease